MNAPLARFLAEFSEDKREDKFEALELDVLEAPVPEPEPPASAAEPVVTLTVASIAHAMREAREAAGAEERARVEALMEARLAEQNDALTQSLAAAREAWVTHEGQRLGGLLAEAMGQLQANVVESAGQALRPLFSEAIRIRILAELRMALASILSDPAHPAVRIAGPADLLSAFGQTQNGETAIDYIEADQVELTITTDQTRIESRFATCLAAFHESEG